MFKYYHLLPGDVSKQKPRLLFDMLDGLTKENKADKKQISDVWKCFCDE